MNFIKSIPRELRKAREELPDILGRLRSTYKERTHPKVLLIDNLIFVCFLILVTVFFYGKIFGTHPDHSYFAALFCPIGLIALACKSRLPLISVSTLKNLEVGGRDERQNWRRLTACQSGGLSWRIHIRGCNSLFVFSPRDELSSDSINFNQMIRKIFSKKNLPLIAGISASAALLGGLLLYRKLKSPKKLTGVEYPKGLIDPDNTKRIELTEEEAETRFNCIHGVRYKVVLSIAKGLDKYAGATTISFRIR